jgi:hypothetical protein
MSRAKQGIGAFGKGMLTKLRPFCTDAHRSDLSAMGDNAREIEQLLARFANQAQAEP